MIEGARQILGQVLTVEAVNANLEGLNDRFAASKRWPGPVPLLPSNTDPAQNGVQDMWHKTYRDLTRPGVGYMVGVLRAGRSALRASGKNQMVLPVWVDCISTPTDPETAVQQCGVLYQAVLYTLEDAEGVFLADVSPPVALVLIEPGTIETITVDAAAAGRILGVRAVFNMTVDDARA